MKKTDDPVKAFWAKVKAYRRMTGDRIPLTDDEKDHRHKWGLPPKEYYDSLEEFRESLK